jgi:hypothetical protein
MDTSLDLDQDAIRKAKRREYYYSRKAELNAIYKKYYEKNNERINADRRAKRKELKELKELKERKELKELEKQ